MTTKAKKKKQDPRQKILESATRLFARKGFSTVSVREITKEAGVNLAMVSYYFEGKKGILIEIINQFFDSYEKAIQSSVSPDMNFEEKIYSFVRSLTEYIKDNKDIFRVAYYELPYDTPDIFELRGEKIGQIRQLLAGYIFPEQDVSSKVTPYLSIIGPAILSMVFSNFILEPVIEAAFQETFDDDYYEKYAKSLSIVITRGLAGFIADLELNKMV